MMPAPRLYRVCDALTESLLYVMIVFTPWAFGTTQPWAIWTMNTVGYMLGLLLLGKWAIPRLTGYVPARWGTGRPRWPTWVLGAVTVFLPGWCLTSAVNARATLRYDDLTLEYRDKDERNNNVSNLSCIVLTSVRACIHARRCHDSTHPTQVSVALRTDG